MKKDKNGSERVQNPNGERIEKRDSEPGAISKEVKPSGQDLDLKAMELSYELVETSNAIIIGLDINGNITIFNKGAERALGYKKESIEGTSWFEYIIDNNAERGILEVFQWTIGNGSKTQYENRVRSNSGRVITVSWENTVIFDHSGNLKLILMVGQDITKMKRLEENLRVQSERLMAALDEIALYNDLMVHNINNANTGIMGYLELIKLPDAPLEKRMEFVDRALSEVRKSSSIISDVKIMSLSQTEKEGEAVDLSDSIEKAITILERRYPGNGRSIRREDTDMHVIADDLLVEGLIRILEDAINRCGEKELLIDIRIGRDPSLSHLVSGAIHIRIIDNGKPLPREQLETPLNKPPRWVDKTMGLGHYLVGKIIERYGGFIWLESGKDEGGLETHILLKEAV